MFETATTIERKPKNTEKKKSSLAAKKSPKKKSNLRKKAGKPKPRSKSKPKALPRTKPNPLVGPKAKGKAAPVKRRNACKAPVSRLQAKKKAARQEKQRANKLAFVNFIKKFREATCLPNEKGRKDSLKKAAKAWCGLHESQRRKFYTMPRIN